MKEVQGVREVDTNHLLWDSCDFSAIYLYLVSSQSIMQYLTAVGIVCSYMVWLVVMCIRLTVQKNRWLFHCDGCHSLARPLYTTWLMEQYCLTIYFYEIQLQSQIIKNRKNYVKKLCCVNVTYFTKLVILIPLHILGLNNKLATNAGILQEK